MRGERAGGGGPLTEVSERYRRLADAFAAKLAAVPDGKWSSLSPCTEWTVRDLVAHVVATQGMFLGFVGREIDPGPSAEDDPVGAWETARSAIQRDLEVPDRAQAEFQGFSGPSTFEAAVDRFLCTDLVVHGWDVARTAGLDEHIDPADVARVRDYMEPMGDALRGPQAFGPAIEPPAGADEQARLLAFLGRQP